MTVCQKKVKIVFVITLSAGERDTTISHPIYSYVASFLAPAAPHLKLKEKLAPRT